jgi:hypothetical protein
MNRQSKSQGAFLLLLLIFFGNSALISGQTTENIISVTVSNPLNQVVPDAQIVLTDSNQKEKKIKTNKSGVAQFTGLSLGEYSLTITAKGFAEYKSEPIVLQSSGTTKINITLEISQIEEKVVVGGNEGIEADSYGMVTVLSKEEIDKLPDDPQEFLKALRQIAGESITGENLPINVNGINGLPIPPKQLIDQIRIDRNAFSAKYGGMGGGGIQITTSSRVEKFRGSFNFGFADSSLNAGNPYLGRKVPFQSRNYMGSFSGPLSKKASFSIFANRSERNSNTVIDAVTLDENLNPVEIRKTFPTVYRNQMFNISINSDFNKKNKALFTYSFAQSRGDGQGVGQFNLPERASSSTFYTHSFALSHTYLRSDYFVNRLVFSGAFSNSKNIGENSRPAINVAESFSGGGSTVNSSNQNWNFILRNEVTHQVGKLSLEYGFSLKAEKIIQNSQANFNGTFSFNGRIAPVLDNNNNPLTDNWGNVITQQITSLESYQRTLFFSRLGFSAARIRELGGGADQFSISRGNPVIRASQIEYDAYIQGSYNLKPNLGMSLGLRYENQNNISSPFNLAPRFSLIWTPKKKGKESVLWSLPRVSTGIGVSYQRFRIGNLLSVRQTTDAQEFYFISMASAFDSSVSAEILNSFPNAPSINSLQKISLLRSRRFFEDGFQTPVDITSNVTLNKKLPAKFTVVFSISYTRGFRRQISTNINAPLGGTFDQLNPQSAIYPFNNSGNIYRISSKGKSENFRFSANLIFPAFKILKKNSSISLRYSVGKSSDNIVSGSGSPFDAYDFRREFAPSASDGVQTIGGIFIQELPFYFRIGGNWSFRSGTRFNIITGRDSNGDGFYSERPAFASNPNKAGVIRTQYGLLDPNPTIGDKIIPRNLGRGPHNVNFDLHLSKTIPFNGDIKNKQMPTRSLTVSMFVSNVFNINNKGNPLANMSSPRFTRIISDSNVDFIDDSVSRSNPRSINFGLNFNF